MLSAVRIDSDGNLVLQLAEKVGLDETAEKSAMVSKDAGGWPSAFLIPMAVPVLLDGVIPSVVQVCSPVASFFSSQNSDIF